MRNSPPIHTCSEHAQGPSKPPAVVRKLWCLNVCCFVPDLRESPTKWQLLTQRRGEGGGGGHQGGTHSSFSWCGRSKMHLLKVTAIGGSFFADSNQLWASFCGRILPMATCESMLGSKVKCGETLEYWVLYYCDSGHSQVTLNTLTWPHSYASLFPCLFIIGFWLPLPCLFYIVLRLKCAPLTWLGNIVPRLKCLGYDLSMTLCLCPSLEFNELTTRRWDKHSF